VHSHTNKHNDSIIYAAAVSHLSHYVAYMVPFFSSSLGNYFSETLAVTFILFAIYTSILCVNVAARDG
jgi:hypothetical protein